MIIVDVGAHTGTFIDHHPDATVYAFEPNPINFKYLVDKYADNANIHIYNIALSSEHGTIKLYRFLDDEAGLGLSNTGRSSILSNNKDVVNSRFWEVPTTRLTTFMHENSIDKIDILKIDTEGSEYDILEDIIKHNALAKINEILYEDHSFLFDEQYAIRANVVTRELYSKHSNPHMINRGNITTYWTSEVPYVKWKLEFPIKI